MNDDYEQRECEQQRLIEDIIMGLHRTYEDHHLQGFAAAATVILDTLRFNVVGPGEPSVIATLNRIKMFARTDAEHRFLLGRLLSKIVQSLSFDISREHMAEVLRK